ncbi:unnamed protein product [Heterosigma akashiwo]|uniref:ADF-H domain-containing protein n=1 Tax=Heterosigma akashiwo TaxID=2829 RepID=A0A6V1UB73_HETAK|mmetsp:Transcript_53832/g.78625  ORF Transcript_53832/g.78625 Transcript_53832/m.78625 type:complete len:141 (-) Transcript_53832:293-715(-)
MATGVGVDDAVSAQFDEFKLQRAPYNLRFYTYKIEDGNITIDTTGPREATWDDFCENFQPGEPKYGLFDLEYETQDGRPTSKLVLLSWSPDDSNVRKKMLYAGSVAALKSVLVGVTVHITATDASEMEVGIALDAARRFG